MARNISDLSLLLSRASRIRRSCSPLHGGKRYGVPRRGARSVLQGESGSPGQETSKVIRRMSRACWTSCQSASGKVFEESCSCAVDETQPDYPLDAVWQRRCSAFAAGRRAARCLGSTSDPAKRALLKPEAIYEIELGLKQSALMTSLRRLWSGLNGIRLCAACLRSTTTSSRRQLQLFPFRCQEESHWPQEIAGQKMETYHESDESGASRFDVRLSSALAVPARLRWRAQSADGHPDHRP